MLTFIFLGCGGGNDSSVQQSNQQPQQSIRVLDSRTNRPVANATFSIYYVEEVITLEPVHNMRADFNKETIASGITDSNGSAQFVINADNLPLESDLFRIENPSNLDCDSLCADIIRDARLAPNWGYFVEADAAGYSNNIEKRVRDDILSQTISISIDPL